MRFNNVELQLFNSSELHASSPAQQLIMKLLPLYMMCQGLVSSGRVLANKVLHEALISYSSFISWFRILMITSIDGVGQLLRSRL
jgi:hypothetical protein